MPSNTSDDQGKPVWDPGVAEDVGDGAPSDMGVLTNDAMLSGLRGRDGLMTPGEEAGEGVSNRGSRDEAAWSSAAAQEVGDGAPSDVGALSRGEASVWLSGLDDRNGSARSDEDVGESGA
jgi:hypothetical protein